MNQFKKKIIVTCLSLCTLAPFTACPMNSKKRTLEQTPTNATKKQRTEKTLPDESIDAKMQRLMGAITTRMHEIDQEETAHCRTPGALGTDLLACAESGNLAQVKRLINAGAPIDFEDYHYKTPLYRAIEHGHTAIALHLINKGAHINVVSRDGNMSILHEAVRRNNIRVVMALIEKKVLVDALDNENKTPLYYAVQNKHINIVALLCVHTTEIPLHATALNTTNETVQLLTQATAVLLELKKNNRANEDWLIATINTAIRDNNAIMATTLLFKSFGTHIFNMFWKHKNIQNLLKINAASLSCEHIVKECALKEQIAAKRGSFLNHQSVVFTFDV